MLQGDISSSKKRGLCLSALVHVAAPVVTTCRDASYFFGADAPLRGKTPSGHVGDFAFFHTGKVLLVIVGS